MSIFATTLKWISIGLVVVIGVVCAVVAVLLMSVPAQASCAPTKVAVEAGDVTVGSGPASDAYFASIPDQTLVAEMKVNAAIIISVGRSMELSENSVAIGVGTAIQEAGLVNLPYGADDSLGLFQQRPSVKSWGTAEQIMDPVHAATKFFERLKQNPNRDAMPMKEAAILVQIPDRRYYDRDWKWDAIATELVSGTPTDQSFCLAWVAPIDGVAAVPNSYGMRKLSDDPAPRMHWGTDIPAGGGTEIRAAGSGVVMFVGYNGGYGNYVSIDHGDNISTGYAHMVAFEPTIHVGDHVDAGQVIGYVGNTGHSFGNHLHYETTVDGEKVDPVEFMRERGVDLENPTG